MTPRELAALRPDVPAWLDLRGFLRSGRVEITTNDDPRTGFVVRALDQPVAVVAGAPSPEALVGVVRHAGDSWHLLAGEESVAAVRAALPSWRERGVTIHERVRHAPAPDAPLELTDAPEGWADAALDLSRLDDELRDELETPSVRRAPLVAALDDGAVVASCYVAVESETMWDVAVDTAPAWRRRGLAAACFEALAARMAVTGRRPIWGSLDENEASMRLAARLGFEPCARLVSFVPDRG